MSYFAHILLYNIIPLTVMISIGIVLQRSFQLDIKTLSKLNFYLFSPSMIFKMLYETQVSMSVFFWTLTFFAVFMVSLALLMEAVIRLRKYQGGMKSAMRNSVIFYNSANYAVPLNQLVFGDPFTLSIQIIIMMMQSLLPNTYGIYSVNAHRAQLKAILRQIVKMPVIYAIPLALLLKAGSVPIPESIYIPLDYVASGFIATALLTLGVQLGSMKWKFNFSDVLLSNILRLCVAPLLGAGIVWLLGIEGVMAKALILSCAVPTSLSSVLLAVEFDNEAEFASQAVFSSTVFSIFTVTIVIYLLQTL
jgi:hypothetical protein